MPDPPNAGVTIILKLLDVVLIPLLVALIVNETVVLLLTSVVSQVIAPEDELTEKPPPNVPL